MKQSKVVYNKCIPYCPSSQYLILREFQRIWAFNRLRYVLNVITERDNQRLRYVINVITERDNLDLEILKCLFLDQGDPIQRCFEKKLAEGEDGLPDPG